MEPEELIDPGQIRCADARRAAGPKSEPERTVVAVGCSFQCSQWMLWVMLSAIKLGERRLEVRPFSGRARYERTPSALFTIDPSVERITSRAATAPPIIAPVKPPLKA
jgi:hypothetical protein